MKTLYGHLTIIQFLLAANGIAQWTPTNGPYAGAVMGFATAGTDLYAGTYGGGVQRSTDNGASWTPANGGLGSAYVTALAYKAPYLFAATSNGMFRTADNGATWTEINNGTSTSDATHLAVSGNTVYCAYGNMVYSTANDGDLWTPTNIAIFSPSNISGLVVKSNKLFVATTYHGVYASTDLTGSTWNVVNNGLDGLEMLSIGTDGNTLYAGTRFDKLFKSTNNGLNWSLASTGLPSGSAVISIAFKSGAVYVGGNIGVYRSLDAGASWTAVAASINPAVDEVFVKGDRIFVSSWEHDVFWNFREGVFYSDDGEVWVRSNQGLMNSYPIALERFGELLFAGMDGGAFRSMDQGNSWQEVSYMNAYFKKSPTYSFDRQGSNVLAGTAEAVYYSEDLGDTWVYRAVGIQAGAVRDVLWYGPRAYAATDIGVYMSLDQGIGWSLSNSGLATVDCQALFALGDTLFAGTSGGGVFLSPDSGETWVAASNGLGSLYVYKFVAVGSTVFAATSGGVFRSADRGANWQLVHGGSGSQICTNGSAVFIPGGYSTNMGQDWIGIQSPDIGLPLFIQGAPITVDDTYLYYGVQGMGVWRSSLADLVGVAEVAQGTKVTVFPNPMTDQARIQVEAAQLQNGLVFTLTNALGQQVYQTRLAHTTTILQRGHWANGLYLYQLHAGGQPVANGRIVLY